MSAAALTLFLFTSTSQPLAVLALNICCANMSPTPFLLCTGLGSSVAIAWQGLKVDKSYRALSAKEERDAAAIFIQSMHCMLLWSTFASFKLTSLDTQNYWLPRRKTNCTKTGSVDASVPPVFVGLPCHALGAEQPTLTASRFTGTAATTGHASVFVYLYLG